MEDRVSGSESAVGGPIPGREATPLKNHELGMSADGFGEATVPCILFICLRKKLLVAPSKATTYRASPAGWFCKGLTSQRNRKGGHLDFEELAPGLPVGSTLSRRVQLRGALGHFVWATPVRVWASRWQTDGPPLTPPSLPPLPYCCPLTWAGQTSNGFILLSNLKCPPPFGTICLWNPSTG